jgi:methionyl-tRNA formyltransferase
VENHDESLFKDFTVAEKTLANQLDHLQEGQDRLTAEQHYATTMSQIKDMAESAAKIEVAKSAAELSLEIRALSISQGRMEEKVDNVIASITLFHEKFQSTENSFKNCQSDCQIRLTKIETEKNTWGKVSKVIVSVFLVALGVFLKFIFWPTKLMP